MKQMLKPARNLLIASIVLSALYVLASALVVVLQPFLREALYGGQIERNVYPALDLFFLVLRAVIHIIPAVLLLAAIDKKAQNPRLQTASLILLIYFSVIRPILSGPINVFLTYVGSRNIDIETLQSRAMLIQFLSVPGFFYTIAMFLFVVSLAMIWYLCYLAKGGHLHADIGNNDGGLSV